MRSMPSTRIAAMPTRPMRATVRANTTSSSAITQFLEALSVAGRSLPRHVQREFEGCLKCEWL
jgi:hypothetical protein